MTKHKVTLIPGEGIGPEVAAATRRILEATGVQIEWEEIAGRSDNSSDQGKTVNQAAVESVRRNRVALKGPMATAIAGGAPSVNVALRSEEHTSELQSLTNLVCRLLLEKKKHSSASIT